MYMRRSQLSIHLGPGIYRTKYRKGWVIHSLCQSGEGKQNVTGCLTGIEARLAGFTGCTASYLVPNSNRYRELIHKIWQSPDDSSVTGLCLQTM